MVLTFLSKCLPVQCCFMSTSTRNMMKLALVQLKVSSEKPANVKRACEKIKEAVSIGGADLVCLPECFNSPYGTQHFPEYAEAVPGITTEALSSAAKENSCYLVGGSIPERDSDGRLYNTLCVFKPSGEMLGKFRKMHLFDIDIPGKIRFMESEVLTAGNETLAFEVPSKNASGKPVKVGVGICYDIRFPALAQIYRQQGCHLVVYPGAFNMTTGPMHWELLQRSRATDNQMYVATCAPARVQGSGYVSWANSNVVDPWAKVIASAGEDEAIIYSDIDLNEVENVRNSIPILKQMRTDLYQESKLI